MEESSQKDKTNSEPSTTREGNLVIQNNDILSLFKRDKSFVFAHKKIGKLVSALYLITDRFDDKEPIKWDLRGAGLKLLSFNVDLIRDGVSIEILRKNIKEKVLEVVSCLEVASIAGLLSKMNLIILKREFFELLNHLDNFKNKSGHISSKFYYVDYENQNEAPKRTEVKDINIGGTQVVEVNGQEIDKTQEKDEKLREFSTVTVKKNRRQSIIIALLKKKKELMIKDVSPLISDCSEKTIQRELQDLVRQGILKKNGEKRWTRYSLV